MALVDQLAEMVSGEGEVAGLRIGAWYAPIGGPDAKISPPRYPIERNEGPYLLERRYDHGGEPVEVVLLDSLQAQANRCEEALLELADDGRIGLPFLELTAEVDGWSVRLTSLDAPHRSRDAYFRDSVLDGAPFEDSAIGRAMRRAEKSSLRPFFEHSPAATFAGR